ncbi:MAG: YncE family protein [Bacteroidota bacterium]|jgi:DNA-binding beta-propeller fold protein YncE
MRKTIAALVILLVSIGAACAQVSGYKIIDKVKLGGEGGWDYLNADPVTGMLFVSRGTHVQVMDMEKRTLAADIPNTNGVHGIALAHEFGKGYISDGRDSAVTVFDVKTFKTIKVIKIKGLNPDAIIYDDASKRVFTFNGRSSDATAIDAAWDSIVGTVPLDGKPEFAQADGRGNIYVNIEDKSTITSFNAKTLKVLKTWSIAPGEEASGLAIDRNHHRLYSVAGNKKMIVSDYEAGKVVADIPIGEGPDAAAYDPGNHFVFSSNGRDGTLTVVLEEERDTYTVLENVKTQQSARTMALDPKTHRIYLAAAEFGKAPEPTKDNPRPRPPMVPGSFTILILGR